MSAPYEFESLLRMALAEDLCGGDLTTEATISPQAWAKAEAVAKSPLVVSGGDLFSQTFFMVHPGCRTVQLVEDGQKANTGDLLFQVEGPARALLMAERTALNFLQRLSGTATLTAQFVEAAAGKIRVADTRKTTPGFRLLERRAVRHGGGHNHRDNLGSAVMIKDNHIAASGGIESAVASARSYAPHTAKIEVEVSNLNELEQALRAGADIIMLDNFSEDATKQAIAQAKGKALIELSGNMTLERVRQLADWGADVVSIGALTHSAPAADISLRISPVSEGAPPVIGA